MLHLRIGLEIMVARHADKILQRLQLAALGLNDRLLLGRPAVALPLLNRPKAGANLVMDVLGNQDHFLEHLLLVVKAREGRLELSIQFLKFDKTFFASGLAAASLPLRIFLIYLLIER